MSQKSFLFRNLELLTQLIHQVFGIADRIARTLDALTTTKLIPLESTFLVRWLDDHVVVLHNQEIGQLLPTGNHLVTLLAAVVRQELHTGIALESKCLDFCLCLQLVVYIVEGILGIYKGNLQVYPTRIELSGGILNIDMTIDANAPMYNLSGQKVGRDYKGVIIQNGKKLICK